MSQVSYGTITITDTNDIERIYMEYAQSTSNSVAPTSGWSENIPAWQQGYYIWQRTVTKMQGVSLTDDSYGDPVCLTGSTGSQGPQGNTGVGVSSITTTYCNYGTGTPAATYSGWQTTVPAYDSSKPNYWVKTVVNYNDGTSGTPVIYKDNGITSATSTAAAANTTANQANQTAGQANQTANQANETANQANTTAGNALSVANSANDAISDLNQYFWRKKTASTNVPAGSYVTNIPGTTYESNPAQGGFNSLVQSTGIFLRNGIATLSSWTGDALTFYNPVNNSKAIELDGTTPSLKFYVPSKTTQVTNLSMELTSSALILYKIGTINKTLEVSNNGINLYGSSTSTADVTLTSSGLKLVKGGITARTAGQSGFIYLSTENYGSNLIINNHQASNWREIIGTKFGVDADGNLYASNVNISGNITASSLVIDSSASVEGLSTANIAGMDAYSTTTAMNSAINTATSGLATKSDAVYRTQRIYYRKTSSGAPSKNTTWLASSGTGYGNWSTKIPQLTSGTTKYPYLYTAVQTQTITQYNGGSGTNCSCSDVLLDDSTTVIDGGSIVTGKVAANYIDVDTLIANNSIVVGDDITDMATKTYVGNQGYQTAANVNTIISNTNVSALSDGSDYTKTDNLANTTAVQNAAKTASNYLGDTDDQTGVTLKAVNGTTTDNTNTSNYIKINSDGLQIFRQGLLVANFGENIKFSSESPQYIGNNNAYIVFDPTGNDGKGTLTIGGATIYLSDRTLEEVLAEQSDLSVRNFIHNSQDMIYTSYGFDTITIPVMLVNEMEITLTDENGITLIL